MSKTSKLIITMLAVIAVAVTFAAGFTFGQYKAASTASGLDTAEQIWDLILNNYVDQERISTDNMSRMAIEGILAALDDPHSGYLDAEYFQMSSSDLEGEFEGIGAYITINEAGQLEIIAPIAGSPAEAAGIIPGDIILEVDGELVSEMSPAEAIVKIRGEVGTPVNLLVLHEGAAEPELIEVIRARIEVPSVSFEMSGEIACIAISEFTERTADELAEFMEDPAMAGARGIVLDLRGNPGGLLDTVLEVAGYFLESGPLLKVRDKDGRETIEDVVPSSLRTDLPMVVLVDGASASGSEVLSGALQDYGRATVAGTTTYGKGSVNVLFPLKDGSGLYLTIARWLTPNGRLIEGEGIEPDIELELTGDDGIKWAVGYLTTQ